MKAKLTFIPAADGIGETLQEDECLIFTHIPKAAGTTLDRLLKGVGAIKNVMWSRAFGTVYYQFLGKGKSESLDNFLAWDEEKKNAVRIITGHVPFGIHDALARKGRYVTLLREPVSRTVSHYRMGVAREGWSADEPLSEVFRKGGLVSDVQVRMLAGINSPHQAITQEDLNTALHNLREYYFLIGFSDTFAQFTSALLGFLDAPNALLGEEQSTRVKLRPERERALKAESEQYNQFDMLLVEQAREIAQQKFDELVIAQSEPNWGAKPTLVASSQVKFSNNEYSIIPAEQLQPVVKRLLDKGVTIEGLSF